MTLAAALLWLKVNSRMVIAGSIALAITGFVLLAMHWKAEAEKSREVIAGQKAVIAAEENHAAVVRKTQTEVTEETDKLRNLPDAQKPIDPVRRAALCDSLKRLRHEKHLACDQPASPALP